MAEGEILGTRFENTTAITPDAVRAMIWEMGKRNKGPWVLMGLFTAVALGFAVYHLLNGMASFAALFLFACFIMPVRTVLNLKRQTIKVYDSLTRLTPEKKRLFAFSDTSFTYNEGKPLHYNQPNAFTENADYYYLFFGDSPLFIEKSGFTKGNSQDFKSFIQERIAGKR